MKKDNLESFYDECLQFKYYFQSKLDGETQLIENKSDYENQILKNRINHLEQENINSKNINEDLKNDTKSHLKIIETLLEGNPIEAPWQTTSLAILIELSYQLVSSIIKIPVISLYITHMKYFMLMILVNRK